MKTTLELTTKETKALFEVIKIFTLRILDDVPSFKIVMEDGDLSIVIKVPKKVSETEIDELTLSELKDAGFEAILVGEWATVKL